MGFSCQLGTADSQQFKQPVIAAICLYHRVLHLLLLDNFHHQRTICRKQLLLMNRQYRIAVLTLFQDTLKLQMLKDFIKMIAWTVLQRTISRISIQMIAFDFGVRTALNNIYNHRFPEAFSAVTDTFHKTGCFHTDITFLILCQTVWAAAAEAITFLTEVF